ncbi:hypothetical protein SDRG_03049 [Saprolegnia diclina VS20]|uniref:F-box domain-containing protein n=1 Tax=Saprolegnia diclina (strain VS20) TaxID=1156394 RepID=T0SA04_SAPDV|nr:hypothetical protein SDRG_03049 [Saprolegnia diclina VS20]EQC39617.1 hypothetical protein SDRG_03049 [Saprolegnia diclina VS20]|eukprot:XP_008606889.1 hypothetical protein SDRG_03049 [Saprolegnia diclina VS20]
MSSSKRPAAASPTVLHLDHVLTAIVQCMVAAKDVKTFLAALPPSARRGTHLAALHDLLQAPQRHVLATEPRPLDALWPVLRLGAITPVATSLVRHAMPVFTAASVHCGLDDVPTPMGLDAFEWLHLWRMTITQYKHTGGAYDLGRLCSLLGQCRNLKVLDVGGAIGGQAILEAVTTSAHCVRSITGISLSAGSIASVDRWLASGHAEHLDLTSPTENDAADRGTLSAMLLKTNMLSSLTLRDFVPGTLASLVAVAPSFDRLRCLDVSIGRTDVPVLLQFLRQLHGQQLCSLKLSCHGASLTELVEALTSFPALEELELSDGYLGGRPPVTVLPLTLRRVTLRRVLVTKAAWETLTFGLSRAHVLTELSWVSCRRLQPSVFKAIATSLPNWIRRGIRNITLDDCDLDDDGASAIARVLRETTSQSGVSIVLRRVFLSVQNYVALGDALTTCRGISIVLPSIDSEVFRAEATKRRITYHVDNRKDRLVLESAAESVEA